RHPLAQEARLRDADGGVAQRRARSAAARAPVRGIGRRPRFVPPPAHRASHRRARGESGGWNRPSSRPSQSRDLGAHLSRPQKRRGRRRGASGDRPMKILYVCHRFPFPPKRGGKIRPFNMIKHLAQDNEVTVASLVRSEQEAKEGEGLARHCAHYEMGMVRNPVQILRMLARLPTTTPSSMGYFYSPTIARRVRELLAGSRFDLIFVHCSSVAQYVEHVRGTPKILDFGDMDSQKWLEYARYKPFPLSLGYRLEWAKLERAEKELARKFDLCTATTRAEWQTFEGYGPGVASDWFPNGVDSDYFRPNGEPYDPDTIAFVGRMDYYPNQECMFDFCSRILPLLQAKRPGLKLLIVGADPSPAVLRLGTLRGVTVTGSVADVRPYLRRAALMVAPLNIARGTQNKILEAM